MHFYFFFSLVILYARIYTIVEKEKACGFGNIYEGYEGFLFLREMLNPEFDGKTRGRDFALFECVRLKKKKEKKKREKKT